MCIRELRARMGSMTCVGLVGVLMAVGGCASGQGGAQGPEEESVIHTATPEESKALDSRAPMTSAGALLYVNGLGCPLCATNIDRLLLRKRAIDTAIVDLGHGTVLVGFADGREKPSAHQLKEWVKDAGFTLVKVVPQ